MTNTETAAPSRGAQIAEALRVVADMMEANPELAEDMRYTGFESICFAFRSKDQVVRLVRAAKAHGAQITKHHGDKYFSTDMAFGPVVLGAHVLREEVCERVVVGTRQVTKTVKDPVALAAVPDVEVTEDEPIVEWHCTPLLADDAPVAAA